MGTQGVNGEAERRRAEAVARINAIDRDRLAAEPDRAAFFDTVYELADGDAAGVPWADLAAKPELVQWLADNSGGGRRAVDVACGLGDNAEAIAAAGYRVTAFDGSPKAVDWARRRFPHSSVEYRVADLLDPPAGWRMGFDLVHECYTVQSVPPERHVDFIRAVAGLVAPAGTLVVYTRTRAENEPVSGPPWPLTKSECHMFAETGLDLVEERCFDLARPGRTIPHVFAVWRRPREGAGR